MEKHELLKEAAENALTKLFSDDSVSQSTTRESLEELASMIEDFLNALE